MGSLLESLCHFWNSGEQKPLQGLLRLPTQNLNQKRLFKHFIQHLDRSYLLRGRVALLEGRGGEDLPECAHPVSHLAFVEEVTLG